MNTLFVPLLLAHSVKVTVHFLSWFPIYLTQLGMLVHEGEAGEEV